MSENSNILCYSTHVTPNGIPKSPPYHEVYPESCILRLKMQEWKNREQIAGVENAGVGKPYRKPNRYYTLRDP